MALVSLVYAVTFGLLLDGNFGRWFAFALQMLCGRRLSIMVGSFCLASLGFECALRMSSWASWVSSALAVRS
jgi:hypothetical protein